MSGDLRCTSRKFVVREREGDRLGTRVILSVCFGAKLDIKSLYSLQ